MNTYHELAEAMRKGAALRPQAFGAFFAVVCRGAGQQICSCALGAAYEGATGKVQTIGLKDVEALFSSIQFRRRAQCPVPDCDQHKSRYISDVVAQLNDTHHWTREAIASWLDTL